MKNVLGFILLIFVLSACKEQKSSNFKLTGSIKGLKKGTVYLQKELDSVRINLDSMVITGEPEYLLQANIEDPILLYLKLYKNDGEEHYIPFFADKGETVINTTLKNFYFDAKIKGSEQQKLLEEYLEVMTKFNDQNLELIEASFLAQKDNDSIKLDSLNKVSNALFKRKYTYTIQYALNHNNSEVAPYLALYEIPNANPVYVDSIYKGLTEKVKQSYYGNKLKERLKTGEEMP
jgi:hypothetical protein